MDAFTEKLSEYLDAELMPAERAALDAHLVVCDECRHTLDALREVAERAASLPSRPPHTDLWPAVAARLEPRRADRIVLFERAGRQNRTPDSRRRFSFTALELAAAAILLVVTSAGLSWFIRTRTLDVPPNQIAGSSTVPRSSTTSTADGAVPVIRVANFADAQYDAAVADLQRALQAGRGRLDPKTIDVLEKNLTIIDQAIDQARQALASDPSNVYLNSYLADARRRKLDLLRDATSALANLPS